MTLRMYNEHAVQLTVYVRIATTSDSVVILFVITR